MTTIASLHTSSTDTDAPIHELAPIYNDILSAYQNYPAIIRPHLVRAATHPIFTAIFKGKLIKALLAIISHLNVNDPYRPIFPSQETLANLADSSTRTVRTVLKIIRDRGWIYPDPSFNRRTKMGEFMIPRYLASNEFRAILGMPLAPTETVFVPATTILLPPSTFIVYGRGTNDIAITGMTKFTSSGGSFVERVLINGIFYKFPPLCEPDISAESQEIAKTIENTQQDSLITVDNLLPVNNKIEGNHTFWKNFATGTYKVNEVFKKLLLKEAFNKKSQPQKTNPTPKTAVKKISAGFFRVPETLRELFSMLGISVFGIFKLMRLAKEAGQWLQNVWQAKREQILSSGATGGRAFNYLKFLLKTGEDFSFRAQSAGMKKPTATSKPSATSPATAPVIDHRIYWNKRFIDGNGTQVRIHGDGSAAVTDGVRKNDYVRPADVPPIYAAIAAGRLWLLEE